MSVIVHSVRHRLASLDADPRIGHMRCGLRVAIIGRRCPRDPLHLVAVPTCPEHRPITRCGEC
jgi:hypothetical protein